MVGRRRSRGRIRQLRFGFVERAEALERAFKRLILGLTLLLAVGLLLGLPAGRYALGWLGGKVSRGWLAITGRGSSREAIDAEWARKRAFDLTNGLSKFRATYKGMTPAMQALFRYGGLEPDRVVLRWGNFDKTLLLPSTVFEPDDEGRSYRLRPRITSVWVRNLKSQEGIPSFYLLPESPQLADLVKTSRSQVVEGSRQTTNSWGFRGPEFNTSAPLRGIVLGDSYMQGILIGDDVAPPEQLRKDLEKRTGRPVAILNTGHIGYSPEQCFYTLKATYDRVQPHFVVLGLFANDFGDMFGVIDGQADWDEGRYWIGKVTEFCRSRGVVCLVVPAPFTNQVEGSRHAGSYPGQVSEIAGGSSMNYLDPMESFVDEEINLRIDEARRGEEKRASALFNGHLGDGHFSPRGARLWAELVGRRVERLLSYQRSLKEEAPPKKD